LITFFFFRLVSGIFKLAMSSKVKQGEPFESSSSLLTLLMGDIIAQFIGDIIFLASPVLTVDDGGKNDIIRYLLK